MQARHQKVKIWTNQKPKNETCQGEKKRVKYCPTATKWDGRKERKKERKKYRQDNQRLKSV